jgi:hypothetical protein
MWIIDDGVFIVLRPFFKHIATPFHSGLKVVNPWLIINHKITILTKKLQSESADAVSRQLSAAGGGIKRSKQSDLLCRE